MAEQKQTQDDPDKVDLHESHQNRIKSYRQAKRHFFHQNITIFSKALTVISLVIIIIFILKKALEKPEGDTTSSNARRLSSTVTECNEPEIYALLYLLLLLYSFVGVAIVCDQYFEPALSEISERLHLSEDALPVLFTPEVVRNLC